MSSSSADPVVSVPTGLCNMQPPAALAAGLASAPPVSPQGRIRLYSDVEWEEFIREWATVMPVPYVQIKRFGGTGDKGADIAGFRSTSGLQGPWDCFQAKHYANSLTFSDVSPEMLKMFRNVSSGDWRQPDSYQFLAPRGCGTALNLLLSNPQKLRTKFLQSLKPDEPLARGLEADELVAVVALARGTDFEVFKSVELLDAVAQHSQSGYHAVRFGTPLRPRPAGGTPPPEPAAEETRYVQQLVDVYRERHPGEAVDAANAAANPRVGEHFQRQRQAFYKAESLRVYARDSVPPGTFDDLQNDIHAGVVDVVDADHSDGWARLGRVLAHVGTLDLARHTLIQVSDIEDRKGICHQLANVNRITWVETS